MFELASKRAFKAEASIDPGSVAANSVDEQTFTIEGLQPDMRLLAFDAPFSGVGVCQAYVSGADKLTVVFVNPTAAPVNESAAVCRIIAVKV